MSSKKRPRLQSRPLFLIAVFNSSLATRTVLVLLLDYGCTLGGLTLFDHGGTVPLTVAVVVAVAFANGDATSNRADANPNTNFFSQCRCRKRRNSGDYQSVFHGILLCPLGRREIQRPCQMFRESS